MSFCLPLASSKGGVWLSVRVRSGVQIDSIGIFVYRPWSSDFRLAPYEVWAGDAFGDVGSSAVQCTLPTSPTAAEPTHGGTPTIVSCHGVVKPYLTLRQLGDPKRWFISEVEVYTAEDRDASRPAAWAPKQRGEVATAINRRFERGAPSNVLAEGGVLVHIFDDYEDEQRPWTMCHEVCRRGSVDAWSSSLVSRSVPWIFTASAGAAGFIMSPHAEIVCAFPFDAGTGGHSNGRCSPLVSPLEDGHFAMHTLQDALQRQYDGSWRRVHPQDSVYNEVIVSSMWWDRNLPWALEAFVFDGGDELQAQMVITHQQFLDFFGLTAEEVPLLRYRCSKLGLKYDTQDPNAYHESCFVDVSFEV